MSKSTRGGGAKAAAPVAAEPAATDSAAISEAKAKPSVLDRIKTVVEWHDTEFVGQPAQARRVTVAVEHEKDCAGQEWFIDEGLCGQTVDALEIVYGRGSVKRTALAFDGDGSATEKWLEPPAGKPKGCGSLGHREVKGYVLGPRA